MSFLRPCKATQNLQILHANTMAYLMKGSSIVHVNEPVLSDCSWDHEENIIWIEKAYPSSLESLLVVIMIMKMMKKTRRIISRQEDCMSDEDNTPESFNILHLNLHLHLIFFIFSLKSNLNPVVSTTFAG